jgi:hypothetical protein
MTVLLFIISLKNKKFFDKNKLISLKLNSVKKNEKLNILKNKIEIGKISFQCRYLHYNIIAILNYLLNVSGVQIM